MASDEKKLLSGARYKPVVNDCDRLLITSNGSDGCVSTNRCNDSMTEAATTHWSSEQYGPRRCAGGNSSYMVPTYHSLPMDIIKRTEYPQSSTPCRGNGLNGHHHHHHHYHHHHHHHLANNLSSTRNHSSNKQHSGCHPQKVHTVPQYGSPPPPPPTTTPSLKDRKSFKNVFVIGFAFMFVYTAFMSLQSLQSSLNTDGGVGVVSLSCMYASTVLSCLLAPWIISKLKCKWTMVSAFILFSAYFAANFYPKHFMLIPAGMILGLLTGPLWSAQATLVTTMGIMHAQRIHNYDTDAVVNKFMGIFYAFYQSSQIWGNIITATVLFNNDTVQAYNPVVEVWRKAATALNESTAISAYIYSRPSSLSYSSCGAKFCDLPFADPGAEYHDYNPIVAGISDDSRHMLLGVYLICGIMGAIIIVALLDKEGHKEESYGNLSSRELCLATVRMLCDPKCQLLMPLVLFLGLQQGFLFGDFTKSYVKCTLGMYSIGLILITFGVVNALSSVAIGYIAKHIKRFAFITAAATFNAGILMVLSLWKPQSLDIPNFYVISACLGLCDAIWQTQTFTLFGVLFMDRQEAAFASYRMFHATGCAIAFGYSYFLCVVTKVYILAGAMGVSLLAYGVIEIRLRLHQQDIKDIVAL